MLHRQTLLLAAVTLSLSATCALAQTFPSTERLEFSTGPLFEPAPAARPLPAPVPMVRSQRMEAQTPTNTAPDWGDEWRVCGCTKWETVCELIRGRKVCQRSCLMTGCWTQAW